MCQIIVRLLALGNVEEIFSVNHSRVDWINPNALVQPGAGSATKRYWPTTLDFQVISSRSSGFGQSRILPHRAGCFTCGKYRTGPGGSLRLSDRRSRNLR